MSERLLITYNEVDLERLNPPSESPDHSTPFVFQGRFQPREDRASWLAVACPVRLADPGCHSSSGRSLLVVRFAILSRITPAEGAATRLRFLSLAADGGL